MTELGGLTANHGRALRSAAVAIDQLLADIEVLLGPTGSPLRRTIDDLSPGEKQVLSAFVRSIHARLATSLARLGIAPPRPSGSARASALNALGFAEIALQELAPTRLRGYGALSKEAERAVEAMLSDAAAALASAGDYLRAPARSDLEGRISRLPPTTPERDQLVQLEQVIRQRGLVALRGSLQALVEQFEGGSYEIAAFGRVSSGKSSLLNALLESPVLPVGITPVTAVPTRIVWAADAGAVVLTLDPPRERRIAVSDLADFVTEEHNPGNAKRVVRVTLQLDVDRLRGRVALVDTPGLGALASTGVRETYAYMPRCDLGLIVIDGSTPPDAADLDLAQVLLESGIEFEVVLSKADRLGDADRAALGQYVQSQLETRLGVARQAHWISTLGPEADSTRAWFDATLGPRIAQAKRLSEASAERKLRALWQRANQVQGTAAVRLERCAHDENAAMIDRLAGEATQLIDKQHRACEEALSPVGNILNEIVCAAAAELRKSPERAVDEVLRGELLGFGTHLRNTVQGVLLEARDRLRGVVAEAGKAAGADVDPTVVAVDLTNMPEVDPPPVLRTVRLPARAWARRERQIADSLAKRSGPALEDALRRFVRSLREWTQSAFASLSVQLASQLDPLRPSGGFELPADAPEASKAATSES